MKTLLPLSIAAIILVGCESDKSTETTAQPANETGPQTVKQYEMSTEERKDMMLRQLDQEYSYGGMPTNVYDMRRQAILQGNGY